MHTKKNNVELNEARKKNIPILSYPEYITKLSENKHRIVIAGSHGKTTITSMIMHVLKSNKLTNESLTKTEFTPDQHITRNSCEDDFEKSKQKKQKK